MQVTLAFANKSDAINFFMRSAIRASRNVQFYMQMLTKTDHLEVVLLALAAGHRSNYTCIFYSCCEQEHAGDHS